MDYLAYLEELNKKKWHPLQTYFDEVNDVFAVNLERARLKREISEEEYNRICLTLDFNEKLNFLKKCVDGHILRGVYTEFTSVALKELIDIFSPLHIDCANGLVLFKYENYIKLAELGYNDNDFFNLHNGLYRECRSVVFSMTAGELVLAPQTKFFNVGETEETSMTAVKEKMKDPIFIEISNKLDGSNLNFRWYKDKVVGSSSSSVNVDNPQSWRLRRCYKFFEQEGYTQMLKDNPDWTFMFEYISPSNQIVVNYTAEQKGLYLFGMRNSLNGKEYPYHKVLEIAKKYGVLSTEIYDCSFEDILNDVDNYSANEKEGWVIAIYNYNEPVYKVKLKVTDYVLIHKALSKIISPNAVIQAFSDGKWDDFYAKVPNSYHKNVDEIKLLLMEYIKLVGEAVSRSFELLNATIPNADKKSAMIYFDTEIPKFLRGKVMSVYNGKENNVLKNSGGGYKKINEIKSEMEKIKLWLN